MRWRRGFFRLWIVASVVIVAGGGLWGYSSYQTDHSYWLRYTTLPGPCSEMRGVFGVDFGANFWGPTANEISQTVPVAPAGFQAVCWQTLATYRRLNYDPSKPRSSNEILSSAYQIHGGGHDYLREPTPWTYTLFPAVGAGASLALLLLGMIVGWVLSGFRRS